MSDNKPDEREWDGEGERPSQTRELSQTRSLETCCEALEITAWKMMVDAMMTAPNAFKTHCRVDLGS